MHRLLNFTTPISKSIYLQYYENLVDCTSVTVISYEVSGNGGKQVFNFLTLIRENLEYF